MSRLLVFQHDDNSNHCGGRPGHKGCHTVHRPRKATVATRQAEGATGQGSREEGAPPKSPREWHDGSSRYAVGFVSLVEMACQERQRRRLRCMMTSLHV